MFAGNPAIQKAKRQKGPRFPPHLMHATCMMIMITIIIMMMISKLHFLDLHLPSCTFQAASSKLQTEGRGAEHEHEHEHEI